jgi:hypothetical protein
MYDLHSSVNTEYINLYQNGRGVLIPFTAYTGQQKILGAGSGSEIVDMNVGVRSAKQVMTRLTTDELWNSAEESNRICNSVLSGHPLLGLNDFQYSSGSLQFPPREVDVNTNWPMDMIRHQQIMMGQWCDIHQGDKSAKSYYGTAGTKWTASDRDKTSAVNWNVRAAANTYGTAVADVRCGILTAILGRDPAGNFCGLDLSVQPLRLELNYGSTLTANMGSNRIAHTFVAYDAYLHISEATGVAKLN